MTTLTTTLAQLDAAGLHLEAAQCANLLWDRPEFLEFDMGLHRVADILAPAELLDAPVGIGTRARLAAVLQEIHTRYLGHHALEHLRAGRYRLELPPVRCPQCDAEEIQAHPAHSGFACLPCGHSWTLTFDD